MGSLIISGSDFGTMCSAVVSAGYYSTSAYFDTSVAAASFRFARSPRIHLRIILSVGVSIWIDVAYIVTYMFSSLLQHRCTTVGGPTHCCWLLDSMECSDCSK